MFKKTFISLLSLLLIFTQLTLTINAENNVIDSQVVEVDGQKLEIKEVKSGKSGVFIYHFDWEDGTKEKLQIKEFKNGRMVAKAIGRKGDEYLIERDLEGDVFVNGELVTETLSESEISETGLIEEGNIGTFMFDEGGGAPSTQGWGHYQTKYTKVSNLTADVSLVAALIAAALKWYVGLLTTIASYIVSRYMKDVWIRVDKYMKFDSKYKLYLLERSMFYQHSNYTGYIGTRYKGPYLSPRQ